MFISVQFFQRIFPFLILAVTTILSVQTAVAEDFNFAGLNDTVKVYEDQYGIPTIKGSSEADVAFVQGYFHARDRFFQMDFFRKTASGRLAELVGSPGLDSDIQLRTMGLRRAALRTWQNSDAEINGLLQSYANGVNAWLNSNPLPPEYAILELTKTEPWTPLDSLSYMKLLAFSLSFDLDDISNTIKLLTYQGTGAVLGYDGTALFVEDTHRTQPADGRVTVPGFLGSIGGIGQSSKTPGNETASTQVTNVPTVTSHLSEETLKLAINARDRLSKSPLLSRALESREWDKGSNEWAVSGDYTESGYPLVANDPHLALDLPPTMHEANLVYDLGEDSYAVAGIQFPGAPGIIHGCNNWICWGSSVHPMDVTDVFQDEVLSNAIGLPTHTVHGGVAEPIQQIYQSYSVNVIDDGNPDSLNRLSFGLSEEGVTFSSPRRNNGPAAGSVGDLLLFIQHTGWGPTTEMQFVRDMNRAKNMEEFIAALQYFDFGSQNWIYSDVEGNIGYFTSAENPIRSDLAAGTVGGGIPPWFIRDGSGALNHEWMPVMNPQPAQSLPFEILPYAEMPQVVNPAWGYIANANNDPVGTSLDNNPVNQLRPGGNGIYYLNNGYSDYRQGRVDRELGGMVASDKPVSVSDMMELQANVRMLDAELTMPTLMGIMGQVPVAPGSTMAQALEVLSTWDYTTPSGLAEGWDAGDDPNMAVEPDETEKSNAAAATVFSVWRSMLVQNTIDLTLTLAGLGDNLPGSTTAHRAFAHHLLNYENSGGIGASGLNFFPLGLAETVAGSLQQALDLLASDEFAPAFANSNDVMDYAWGKLHRIVFAHPLGVDPLNVPNGGGFLDLAPGLPGLARQGGFETVDASSHSARADSLNGFMFSRGPNRRFVGEMTPDGVIGHQTIPGGQSGVFYHQNYSSQLPLWLTNSYHELAVGEQDGMDAAVTMYTFGPDQ